MCNLDLAVAAAAVKCIAVQGEIRGALLQVLSSGNERIISGAGLFPGDTMNRSFHDRKIAFQLLKFASETRQDGINPEKNRIIENIHNEFLVIYSLTLFSHFGATAFADACRDRSQSR
jgi:hypothetical protein